jgi:hypothetical protein
MMATKVGSLKFGVIQTNGSRLDITLHEVKFIPELWVNLFSINKALKHGYLLINQGLSICLSKGSVSVTFDRVMRTTYGSVSGVKLLVNKYPVVCYTLKGHFHGRKLILMRFKRYWDIAVQIDCKRLLRSTI